VSPDGETRLDLGKGLDRSNIGLFSQLRDRIGVLWIGGCAACGSDKAKEDARERARAARCYVVGPVMFMSNPPGTRGRVHVPAGQIDMRDRFMPVVFAPDGSMVAWRNFLRLGGRLGFMV
jgi:hypothetical protein